jgi:mono/diheme cytochrome c family protein
VSAELITVVAVVAGIAWLGVLLVAALRNRGPEEVASNLQPGIDDQQLETRRLENGQKAAIAFSAFLAISLPLYFLSEPSRQAGFVEEFAEASIDRGAVLVAPVIGFDCFSCHGPLGAGGSAQYVEPRTGVTVSWEAPRLDDILYRYSEDEVAYWITFGRANTPMPAWGLAGGGPMNEHQVQDIVNYLKTIQRPQAEVVNEVPSLVNTELSTLASADAAILAAITRQRQTIAEIDQASEDLAFIRPIAERARQILDGAATGFDTDGDGVSDAVEIELTELSEMAYRHFLAFEYDEIDPADPSESVLSANLAALAEAARRDPILESYVAAIESIFEDEGLTEETAARFNAQFSQAVTDTLPQGLRLVQLDPSNPETTAGTADATLASRLVGELESVATSKRVLVDNEERLRGTAEAGLERLLEAQQARRWSVDFAGIASSMGGSEDEARRAVGLFNANCARCHTAGFSAGIAFTQEIGSGGFGPALWDGRPVVQFGEAPNDPDTTDLLVDFILNGSEANRPYGLNGHGSGRMPGFGAILTLEDIDLLARYLRSGNLSGME